VEQAQRRRPGRVGALQHGQQVADDRRPEAVLGDALGFVDPGDPPAGPPVPLEQPHLVEEVGQALDLGLRHLRGASCQLAWTASGGCPAEAVRACRPQGSPGCET
jgi:hypothetical protein